jgi:hypothetical protein
MVRLGDPTKIVEFAEKIEAPHDNYMNPIEV